jgi:glucose dehydrogenase
MKFLDVAVRCLAMALLWSTARAQTYADLLKPNPNNWLHYTGTYDAQRHSLLKQINTGNVSTLQAQWVYHMTGASDFEAVPIVVDSVMYISQWNRVEALDARTGRLIWQYQRPPATRGWQHGVAVFQGKVYIGTADSALVALGANSTANRFSGARANAATAI